MVVGTHYMYYNEIKPDYFFLPHILQVAATSVLADAMFN